jgi:hypothetical protein
MSEEVERLAEVLRGHRLIASHFGGADWWCACGASDTTNAGTQEAGTHEAHLARAVLAAGYTLAPAAPATPGVPEDGVVVTITTTEAMPAGTEILVRSATAEADVRYPDDSVWTPIGLRQPMASVVTSSPWTDAAWEGSIVHSAPAAAPGGAPEPGDEATPTDRELDEWDRLAHWRPAWLAPTADDKSGVYTALVDSCQSVRTLVAEVRRVRAGAPVGTTYCDGEGHNHPPGWHYPGFDRRAAPHDEETR